MEDVLEVYHRPYDEKRPQVCLDEASKQLVGETVRPIPPEPGQPERFDYEYVRNGTANLFMISMPLLGWRAVRVTDRRTALDFAEVVRWLVEEVHEEAEKVVLVMDNLNTHKLASLYEAFPPEQARRIGEHRPRVRLREPFPFEYVEERLRMTASHVRVALARRGRVAEVAPPVDHLLG